MNPNREKIKSVLVCLDEGNYDQALQETDRLPILVDIRIKLFVEALAFLFRKQWKKANKSLVQMSERLEPNLNHEQFILSGFVQVLREVIGQKESKDQPSLSILQEKIHDLKKKLPYVDGFESFGLILREISTLSTESAKGFAEAADVLTGPTLGLIEQPGRNEKASEMFEKHYDEEAVEPFLLSLASSEIISRLVYTLYLNTVRTIYNSCKSDEKKTHVEKLRQIITRIEPRTDNKEHSNPTLYTLLKKEFNLLAFEWFLTEKNIGEGFNWLESIDPGKGMDFLRHGDFPEYSGSSLKSIFAVDSQNEDTFFVLALAYHPYAYKLEDVVEVGDFFDGESLKKRFDIKQKILVYFSSFDFYDKLLEHSTNLDVSTRDEIFTRILKNTGDLMAWKRGCPLYVLHNIFLPYALGEMLDEGENYDEAIFVFETSTGETKERQDAIERCKKKRDGFIYDELKKVLRGLNEREQKQLLGYSKIFRLEFRLRDIVDKTMSAARNSAKWLEDDNKPALKGAKEESIERREIYEKDCYFKGTDKKKSLVDFTTLPELEKILEEYWELFEDKFKDRKQFFALLTQVSPIRKDIAHARLIDDKQLATLSDRCDELDKVIGAETPEEQKKLLKI